MNLLRILRIISLTEGVSYLALLMIAMPLKYFWSMPIAVKLVGWAHGALFIALALITLAALIHGTIRFRMACAIALASLLPAGPFVIDHWLKRPLQPTP